MNKKQQELTNNNLREYFKPGTKTYSLSNFPVQSNASLKHELEKIKKAAELILDGSTIVINPELKSGLRPDLVVINTKQLICYEIVSSETKESIEKKKELYPFPLIIVKI